MNSALDITNAFIQALQAHDISAHLIEDDIQIADLDLVIRPFLITLTESEGGFRLALAVEAVHAGWPDVIADTFLGTGSTAEQALRKAIDTWLSSTFLVLHEYLQPENKRDTVYKFYFTYTDPRDGTEYHWCVIASPLQTIGNQIDAQHVYERLVDNPPHQRLLHPFVAHAADPQLFWSKVYFSRATDGEVIADCWLNNNPWGEGYAAITSFEWPTCESYAAFRQFVLFAPLSMQTPS